jgi:hypothetical protein
MHTIVLVHSPLIGPLTWQPVATALAELGHDVVVPTIAVDGGPPYYPSFARSVTARLSGPVVLVAHSNAGLLLPSIAAGSAVRGAVFVDALLPRPGRTWFDTAPAELREHLRGLARDGMLPPWHEWFAWQDVAELVPDPDLLARFVAEIPALPLGYFTEPAPPVDGWADVPCAYVRLSEGYDEFAAEAETEGWWVRRVDADHLAPLTRPSVVVEPLVAAIEAVTHSVS